MLINFIFAILLVALLASLSRLLGPKQSAAGDMGLPYETGMPPMAAPSSAMSVPYIRYALLFVLFEVDLAFVLPWAHMRGRAGLEALGFLTAFVAMLALMLAYLWRKGLLECD